MDIHGKNPRCLIYIDSEMKHQVLPHVLIVPLPVQGHVTPMLNLAELFCLANLKVTFINSTHNHQRLTRNTDIEARFACYPGFSFRAISDGLPDDHPRNGEDGCKDLIEGFTSNVQPQFKEILSGSSSTNGLANTKDATPVTCLILDGWLSFAYDAAIEAEIPVIAFRCYSACCTWVFSCMAALIETGEIPFKDDDEGMDRHVKNVPGMDNFLRCRDLPSFCRVKDTSSCHDLQQMFAGETKRTEETYALIVNTFEDLEGPILNQIRKRCSKVYSIGPLHAHLKYKLHLAETTSSINSSSSLWEVDRSCISWLDHKPDKAVVYVSFGSLATLKKEQLMEIWAGLVQSKKYFLWVVRSNLIKGSDSDTPTPAELLEGTEERGCMVSWAPQEEVLAHRAIGGFMTHSGWNSTLESIIAGVPMLCWPYFADQQVNSRYVSEVWRIGLDMKDKCDRNIVEKMINDLMDERKEELQRAMAKMSNLANESIAKGGSSYCNLEHLIEDIKAMSVNDVQ